MMINVFLDYGTYSEQIAYFWSEELYVACIPSLEEYAKDNNAVLIESVQCDSNN